jgi:putative transposase
MAKQLRGCSGNPEIPGDFYCFQNAHLESFNGRLRDECLNANWFRNLMDARAKIGAWRDEYNGERPHSSLGYQTPNDFAAVLKSSVMTG